MNEKVETEYKELKQALKSAVKIETTDILQADTINHLQKDGYDVSSFGFQPTTTVIRKKKCLTA